MQGKLWDSVDKEQGMMFCGGEDSYYVILSECVNSYVEMAQELNEAFEKKDYPNYIIKIHGLKSTMKSIGAMDLSEKARVLEFAGKDGEYEKIEAGHRPVMEEFYELMLEISEVSEVRDFLDPEYDFAQDVANKMTKTEEPNKDDFMQELSKEELQVLYAEFEGAMYSLDVTTMKATAENLKNKKCGNTSLSDLSEKMLYKIERGDYFSAGDVLKGALS